VDSAVPCISLNIKKGWNGVKRAEYWAQSSNKEHNFAEINILLLAVVL
jgi:hypothetical protein